MKKIKKLFALLFAITVSFFMINAVLADDVKGSITIEGTTEGKVYEVYKIFDLTYSGTKVAYTIDSDWTDFFKEGGLGAEYIVTSDSTGKLNQITYTDEEGNKSTRYINVSDGTNGTVDNIAAFAQKALTYVGSNDLEEDSAVTAPKGTTATISDLTLGYYLVYPQGATDVSENETTEVEGDKWASIASLTSTLPNASVVVKATYPKIEKEVNYHTFNVGEYAQFTITGNVPDTTGYDTYEYIINDTWTAGLELDKDNFSFTVTIGGKIVNVVPVYNQTNTGFTLTFDMTNYQSGEYKVGDAIVVTYKLKITEDAIDSTSTYNSATLTYSNDPTDNTNKLTTPPEEEYVYSSKIVVTKVDGATCTTDDETGIETCTTKLAGAEFVLTKTVDGETLYYKAVYADDELVLVEWVEDIREATYLTTGSDGEITFEGLKDGNYELVETKAPDGYNKLTGPVSVTVEGTTVEGKPVPVTSTSTVKNNTGIALPITGGIGTTLFIVIGLILVIGSVVVFITNKRMIKEFE